MRSVQIEDSTPGHLNRMFSSACVGACVTRADGFSLVSDISPPDREGRTFGYLWTGALIVSSASPVLVGYIGDTVGLRTAFAVLAVATIVSIAPIALLFSDRIWVPIKDLRSTPTAIDQDD